jgi:alpha-N-acetylglucosaminidase
MNDPKKGRVSGIGALMEGSEANPVLWEYFFGNAWRSAVPDLRSWLDDYTQRRYGAKIKAAEEAWKILAGTIYNAPAAQGEFPVNSVICARPSLNPNQRYHQTCDRLEAPARRRAEGQSQRRLPIRSV